MEKPANHEAIIFGKDGNLDWLNDWNKNVSFIPFIS